MTLEYVRLKNYETTEFDGECIILNLDNYTITKLNEIGGYCWSLLQKQHSANSIKKALEDKYGEACQTTDDEIQSFLYNLVNCGLVKNVG